MIDLLRSRRSIRRYEERAIEPSTIEQLKEAALRAPSSRGISPWTFFFVTDPDVLSSLSNVKDNHSQFIAHAPLAVVISAEESASDVWIEDCAIAGIVIQLTAADLGLGSCWVQIRNRADGSGASSEDRVREILDIDRGMRVDSIISLGYPAQSPPPVPAEKLLWDRIVER